MQTPKVYLALLFLLLLCASLPAYAQAVRAARHLSLLERPAHDASECRGQSEHNSHCQSTFAQYQWLAHRLNGKHSLEAIFS